MVNYELRPTTNEEDKITFHLQRRSVDDIQFIGSVDYWFIPSEHLITSIDDIQLKRALIATGAKQVVSSFIILNREFQGLNLATAFFKHAELLRLFYRNDVTHCLTEDTSVKRDGSNHNWTTRQLPVIWQHLNDNGCIVNPILTSQLAGHNAFLWSAVPPRDINRRPIVTGWLNEI